MHNASSGRACRISRRIGTSGIDAQACPVHGWVAQAACQRPTAHNSLRSNLPYRAMSENRPLCPLMAKAGLANAPGASLPID